MNFSPNYVAKMIAGDSSGCFFTSLEAFRTQFTLVRAQANAQFGIPENYILQLGVFEQTMIMQNCPQCEGEHEVVVQWVTESTAQPYIQDPIAQIKDNRVYVSHGDIKGVVYDHWFEL